MSAQGGTAIVNHAPIVTTNNVKVNIGQSIAASDLVASVTDPDHNSITHYGFWATSSGGGYFTLNGAVQASGTWVTVTAANLGAVKYCGGSGTSSEALYVCAYDGKTWSANASLTATTVVPTNVAPTVTVHDVAVNAGQSISASSLITAVTDPAKNSITQYGFWDTSNGSGHFTLNGVVQAHGQWITVTAMNLASVKYWGASGASSEALYVCAYDGKSWSATASLNATTVVPPTPAKTVAVSGANVMTAAGFLTTVNVTGSGGITVNGDTVINAGTGSDVISVNAGNVTLNGSTGSIRFTGGGGAATLNLKGGATTAQLGTGATMVNIGGAVTAASGTGVDVYTFTKDASIDNAVISKFKVGTDHLHLVGYGAGQSGVASIGKTSAGTSITLTDGSHASLLGVQNTNIGQLFN